MPHFDVANRTRSNAKTTRKQMTDAELKLWNEIRAHRLMGLSFRRQMPIGNFIVDFACPAYKLIIEVDGSGHADEKKQLHDQQRTEFLKSKGWSILRFWNDEVLKDLDGVCSHIILFLREAGVKFE